MDRYNKLKIRTLKVFAFAPGAWFTPGEVGMGVSFAPRRALWTYRRDCGNLACWKGIHRDRYIEI